MEEQFLWSLIESAAKSAHSESLVRPFPTLFCDSSGQKDFEALISAVENRCFDLFSWVTKTLPKLQICTRQAFIKNYFSNRKEFRPDLVISVETSESKERKFYSQSDDLKTVYGFHGSKAENFYSILQHGLVNNLNKRDVFGSGTYLSTEIAVALQFATPQRVNIEVKMSRNFHVIRIKYSVAFGLRCNFNSNCCLV